VERELTRSLVRTLLFTMTMIASVVIPVGCALGVVMLLPAETHGWIVAALMLVAGAVGLFLSSRLSDGLWRQGPRLRKPRRGVCPECGYQRDELPICPECGTPALVA
jgi:hypothetical protein